MVFQIVIKNNVMTIIKEIKIKDQEPLTNLLYITFVVSPTIHKKMQTKTQMIILIKIIIHITKTLHITMIDIEIILDIEAIVEIIRRIITNLILDKDTIADLKASLAKKNSIQISI